MRPANFLTLLNFLTLGTGCRHGHIAVFGVRLYFSELAEPTPILSGDHDNVVQNTLLSTLVVVATIRIS